jgi:CubicO group peptidase (beta-lactamase class C family)
MRHRVTFALALIAFAVSSLVHAQPAQTFAERVVALRTSANLPAIGGATFTSSSIGAVAVSGFRKLGDNTEVTPADLWHIGSISKSFTSSLIARSVERGELKWDATLGELLGPQRAQKFAAATLANVLSHRAGLPANPIGPAYMPIMQSADPMPTIRRRVVDVALATEPLSTPGTGFLYSNIDYILLGSILEQKSGKVWEEIVREEILTPLKLTAAGFGAPGVAASVTQPRGHRGAPGAPAAPLTPVDPPLADNPPVFGPAGTMHMSIADLARWGQEHLRGERGQDGVVKAATFKLLHTPPAGDYALGWVSQMKSDQRVIWHNGSNTLWYAIVAFNPATDKGVALITNGSIRAGQALDALAFEYLTTPMK